MISPLLSARTVSFVATFLLVGCGGAVTSSNAPGAEAGTADDVGTGVIPPIPDAFPIPLDTGPDVARPDAARPDVAPDAAAHCECDNLAACCHTAAQIDNGAACLADVDRGDENACRNAVLRGSYGCLALGFVPHCSPLDDMLCPFVDRPCSQCLTDIRNCGPVIQCIVDPKCKPTWNAVVACDEAGRPFLECFNLLQSGPVPGELILHGAACVDTCQRDP